MDKRNAFKNKFEKMSMLEDQIMKKLKEGGGADNAGLGGSSILSLNVRKLSS